MVRSNRSNGSLSAGNGRAEEEQQLDPIAMITRMAKSVETLAQTQAQMMNHQQIAPPRAENISDFRRLNPSIFRGTESPLDAEQWLINTEGLLTAALIPDSEKVNVVKIQLFDNARTWWQTEETRYPVPTWEDFRRAFLTRFFPRTAKTQMARQFMNLTQGNLSVDDYASEFTRLSRFAPQIVADEGDRARKFEEGLKYELQQQVMSFRYPTYVEVLEAARDHEQLTLNHRGSQQKQSTGGTKRPLQQTSTQQQEASPPPKRPAKDPSVVCNYCGKTDHMRKDCRRANGLCLICGASDHLIPNCPRNTSGAARTQYQSPVTATPRPPLPPQQQAFQQRNSQQNVNPAQQGRAYNLTAEQEDAADLLQPSETACADT